MQRGGNRDKDFLQPRRSTRCGFEHSQSPDAQKCQCTCGTLVSTATSRFTDRTQKQT
ncbi:Hypothetical predicted protein [Scomber scombrus]|uniref:Uncharacterized protein n=1 Tax=Scomber scombrus TaxID=13677 RepID=A0AAV1QDZ3_SCOSC